MEMTALYIFFLAQDEFLLLYMFVLLLIEDFSIHETVDVAFTNELVETVIARPQNNWPTTAEQNSNNISRASFYRSQPQITRSCRYQSSMI